MSHFAVMVIGDDAEAQLQPFHEYECTGVDDEYVIDVDCTDKVDEWLKEEIYVGFSKLTGEDDYFFDEKSANDLLNVGWKKEMRRVWLYGKGVDIEKEIKDYFGYRKYEETGQYLQHTNPNAKWDWYQVGGRWTGFFKMKHSEMGELGVPSWMNKNEAVQPMRADVTTKGNVDIMGMMNDIRKEREIQFDHLVDAIGDIVPVSWVTLREKYKAEGKSLDDAREAYRTSNFNEAIKLYEKANKDVQISGWRGEVYEDYYLHLPLNQARVRYVETAAMNCVTPYAFVKDSQWVERGEMGWWGMASNEKDKDAWAQQFYKMFNELPDDTLLTVVDCHI